MARRIVLDVDFDFFIRESHWFDWGHGETSIFRDIIWPARAVGCVRANLDMDELLTPPNDPTPKTFWTELVKRGWKFGDEDYDPMALAGDSHGEIGSEICTLMNDDDEWEIWHFDAHHDLGYDNDRVDEREKDHTLTCADWLYLIGRWQHVPIKKIVIVYPEWRREPDPLCPGLLEEGHQKTIAKRIEKLREVGCEVEVTYWNDIKPPKQAVTVITTALSSAWVPPWYDKRYEEFVHSSPAWEHQYTRSWDEKGVDLREGWPDNWKDVEAKFSAEAERSRQWTEAAIQGFINIDPLIGKHD